MELSSSVIKGLSNIQNVNNLTDETFLQILEAVIVHLCNNAVEIKSKIKAYSSKPDVVKSAFTDITCLFVEAARWDFDKASLDNFLRNALIIGQRAEKLCDMYDNKKQEIQAQLELTGNSLPHIVDIDWRLNYCIKYNTQNSVGTFFYHIRLTIKEHSNTRFITFTCSLQQLQELVHKLKDAVRHLEKIANM